MPQRYEPRARVRSVGLLQAILATKSLEEWKTDWLSWENEVHRDDAVVESGGDISDSVKVAVCLARAPSGVQAYLQMQAGTFSEDYQKLRGMLASYIDSLRKWPELGRNGKGGRGRPAKDDGGQADVGALTAKGKGRKGKTRASS